MTTRQAPTFVGMSAVRHIRPRCTTLMSTPRPSGESETSLSRLHAMKRSVGRRRAKMPRPEPDPFPGRGLAAALFPRTDATMAEHGVSQRADTAVRSLASDARQAADGERQSGVGEEMQQVNVSHVPAARAGEDVDVRYSSRSLNGGSNGGGLRDGESMRYGANACSESSSEVDDDGSSAEMDMPELRLFREDGTLPWKDLAKRDRNRIMSDRREESHPPLDVFVADVVTKQGDGRLPLKGRRYKASASVPEKPLPQDDGTSVLHGLNTQQRAAVLAECSKACMVLAGPGSGKTRVLTHRIAYLIKKFNLSPSNILAVTFTNKAAGEMKERVEKLLQTRFAPDWAGGEGRLTMGTFHSISARILREFGTDIGVPENFVICDTADSKQLVSRIMKRVEGVSPTSGSVGEMRAMISKLKNDGNGELKEGIPVAAFRRIEEYRAEYDRELRSMQQLDFDDLLLETRRLLQTSSSCLARLQDQFEHVLVDEWQDTNHVQFDIVSLLSAKSQNLFVVGDADQSIYKFRGADSGNLERFSEMFGDVTRITLERNYRSSGCIVAAAQCVIERNKNRPSKQMTTSNEFGNKLVLREMRDDKDEAQYVISKLLQLLQDGQVGSLADIAIMYRTNAQSRLIEEVCIKRDLPYRLLSGIKFYDRQEIRDLVAYLRILSNPADDSAFLRIINTPPRGIGKKTIDTLEAYSQFEGLPLLSGLERLLNSFQAGDESIIDWDLKKNNMKKLVDFYRLFTFLQQKAKPYLHEDGHNSPTKDTGDSGVGSLLTAIIDEVDYRRYLEKLAENEDETSREKARERLGNIDELVRAAAMYRSLSRYLESVTLLVESSRKRDEEDGVANSAISLLTLHGGKGLEFDAVFVSGVEDNIIPIKRAQTEDEIEEERRLLYVGMTRAKRHLHITWRGQKIMVQGDKVYRREGVGPSRFLDDIPSELADRIECSSREPEEKSFAKKTSASRYNEVQEWRVGDSVRCGSHGRGTVTVGAMGSSEGAWIEVLFTDGSRHYVNTIANDVKLLYSNSQ